VKLVEYHAAEAAANDARRAASALGASKSNLEGHNAACRILEEVLHFADCWVDNNQNVESGGVSVDEFIKIRNQLQERLIQACLPEGA